MHHRTVKTPESAAVSLARANRSLAPPRPTPEGWARPRPTAGGQLRLADDWITTHPTPKGYTPPRPTPEGWARPRPTAGGHLRFARR